MFTDVLEKLMRQRDMTRSDLAQLSGIPYTTIDGWFKKGGDSVRLPTLKRLSQTLEVSLDTLADMDGEGAPTPEEQRALRRYRALDDHGRRMVAQTLEEEWRRIVEAAREQEREKRFIPRYNTMAAAGFAAPAEGVDYELMELPDDAPENAQFAVTIDGDSMEPYINNRETVYCVKDSRGVSTGDVGIFCVDGGIYCKQFCTDGKNVYLISLNRARADADITIWATGNRTVLLVGRVLLKKKVPKP